MRSNSKHQKLTEITMEVLKECKRVCFVARLYKFNKIRIGGQEVPDFLFTTLLIVYQIMAMTSLFLVCYQNLSLGLRAITLAFYNGLGFFSSTAIHLCLYYTNDLLIESFDQIQEVTDRSMC